MTPWVVLAIVLAGASAVMAALWLVQWRVRDAGVVDVGWAGCLGAAALAAAMVGDGDPWRRAMVGVMGGVWGFRLAWHLLTDRILKGPEDGRYLALREKWGSRFQPRIFWFFQAQALLVGVLAAPFALAADSARPFGPADAAALALWMIGFLGESLADAQLARFKRDPESKGRVCQVGLWRWSRHPNYFFEWLMWCAFALAAVAHPLWWLGFLSPALILFFVLKVTGIPPTEARALRSRGDAYREYQRTTSAFVPWFPRRARSRP